eukprot:10103494-Lingulodinium_polyedra.AAC.1
MGQGDATRGCPEINRHARVPFRLCVPGGGAAQQKTHGVGEQNEERKDDFEFGGAEEDNGGVHGAEDHGVPQGVR